MNFLGDRYIQLYVDVKDVGARLQERLETPSGHVD